MDNPLLEAYISEKEQERERSVANWAHECRRMYNAFIDEGFTAKQSMKLTKYWWRRIDVMTYWKERDQQKE